MNHQAFRTAQELAEKRRAEEVARVAVPHGMVEVTQAEFYAYMGPRDVHPSVTHSPDYTVWETPARNVLGRSYPGWRNPGLPLRYFLPAGAVQA